MPHFPATTLDTLQAISAIVSIISFPLIFVSLFIAFKQIKSQTEISRKELTFNGLMRFADSYQEISNYRHGLRERFEAGDRGLNQRYIVSFFNKYWLSVYQQFDFFLDGLIPFETFVAWQINSYSFMAGEQKFSYFDEHGQAKVYDSRTHFETRFLGGTYMTHQRFYSFYEQLYKLKRDNYDQGIIPPDKRSAEITAYVASYMKKQSIIRI